MSSTSTSASTRRPRARCCDVRANEDHRHSGIGFHTPADVHYGRAAAVRARRAEVLTDAYAEHRERFVRKPPEPPALPAVVWINEPKEEELRHSDS